MVRSYRPSGRNPHRNKLLTLEERRTIDRKLGQGLQRTEIARIIDRSYYSVCTYLRKSSSYAQKKSPGRPRNLNDRITRHIQRHISRKHYTLKEIQAFLQSNGVANVSLMTMSRCVRELEYIRRRKMIAVLNLDAPHRRARVEWAKQRIRDMERKGLKWGKVIFSDEKRFNLDGPDGYRYYWYDIRKEELSYIERPKVGQRIMVWSAISAEGNLGLIFIPVTEDSPEYLGVLGKELIQFLKVNKKKQMIFQQDNARVHTSHLARDWFAANDVTVLPWPSNSPDLNPIETVWSLMVRKVYAHGKQYFRIDELVRAIKQAWAKITKSEVLNLIDDMPDRLILVIQSNGATIHKGKVNIHMGGGCTYFTDSDLLGGNFVLG